MVAVSNNSSFSSESASSADSTQQVTMRARKRDRLLSMMKGLGAKKRQQNTTVPDIHTALLMVEAMQKDGDVATSQMETTPLVDVSIDPTVQTDTEASKAKRATDVYIKATLNGQEVYIKSGDIKALDVARAKALQSLDDTATVLGARGHVMLQPLKPYLVKVQHHAANVCASVSCSVIVLAVDCRRFHRAAKTKIPEIYNGICESPLIVRVIDSTSAVRAITLGYSSPLLSRAARFQRSMAGGIQRFTVSIKDCAVHVSCAMGSRIVCLQAKASDGMCGAKKWISDFTTKLAAIVSGGFGTFCHTARIFHSHVRDGFLHVACLVHDRIFLLSINITELFEHLQLKTAKMYNTTLTALTDVCSGTKSRVLRVKADGRRLVANPKAQVTTASAVAGAATLGASGGVAGLLAGGAAGAAFALPAALFTFGLSIPVGTAVGAGAGLCLGTVSGGAAGLVSGGMAGYNKDKIGSGVNGVLSKAKACKSMAAASTSKLRTRVMGSA